MSTSTKRNRDTTTTDKDANVRTEKRAKAVVSDSTKKLTDEQDDVARLTIEAKLATKALVKAEKKLERVEADLVKAEKRARAAEKALAAAKAREEENEKHAPYLRDNMKEIYDMAKRTKGMNDVKVTTSLEPSVDGAIRTSCVTFSLF